VECGVVKSVFVEFDGLFVDLVVIRGGFPMSVRLSLNEYWDIVDQGNAIRLEERHAQEVDE
jgi:hypothetical protein